MKGVVAAVCLGVLLLFAGGADAATRTLTVSTTSDTDQSGVGACATGGSCSLREAVNQANLDTGDTITLPALGAPYDLNTSYGGLSFSQSATINGAGASTTVIDGGNATRLVDVSSPAAVTINGVTLQHGSAPAGGAAFVASGASLTLGGDSVTSNLAPTGGGIEDQGSLTVRNSTLSSNTSTGGGGAIGLTGNPSTAVSLAVSGSTLNGNNAAGGGGGILVSAGSAATTVTIDHTTLSGNMASDGGGLDEQPLMTLPPLTLSLSDSTIEGNTASSAGGGVLIGLSNIAETVANDTIADNSAGSGGGGDVYVNNPGQYPVFTNTIVAGGSATGFGGPDCFPGGGTSNGGNIDDGSGCDFTAASDKQSTNPKLGPLQNNGGPTQTMALLSGSPAIDGGVANGCPPTDQRGVARPQGAACDSGAYESAPPKGVSASAGSVSGGGAKLSATVTNPDVQGGTVKFEYGTSASYGITTAAQTLASGASGATFSASISGLKPGTTYHYAVVAQNPDGTAVSSDHRFTTGQFSVLNKKVSAKGAIKLTIKSPGAGSFTVSAKVKHGHKTVSYGKRASAKASGAGNVTLTVKLGKKAAKQLKKLGKAKVTITITFTPSGGSSSAQTITIKVKRKKNGKYALAH